MQIDIENNLSHSLLNLEEVDTPPTLRYIYTLRAESSRKTMEYTLNGFAKVLNVSNHKLIPWEKLNDFHIAMALNKLEENGLKDTRLNTYLTAIKRSATFANGMGRLSTDVLFRINQIQPRKGRVVSKARPLKPFEMTELFITNSPSLRDIRNNAIFALLVGCGLRCSELMTLQIDALVYKDDQHWVRFFGKGHVERCVPINDSTLPYLEEWVQIRKELKLTSTTLFIRTRRGNTFVDHPIKARSSIYRLVQSRCLALGAKFMVSPHDLRRTTATILYHAGVRISVIQDILGHADEKTTQRYIQKDEKLLIDAIKNVSLPSLQH
ncbi:tyrosine-type recombinase/integrase [Aliivibrio fischeri]|uniref:tyrosine-type recombinase/integrase n=1 Tax=Aliivibrio fischeri TaxID=668 RepID=UPI0007C485C5|nr:tyrosine-type recombinase/integrase [Aliivibrio fischeri]